jgi:hypothetical protein
MMIPERKRDQEYLTAITLEVAKLASFSLFHRLVNSDLRGQCHPTVSEVIRSPELVDRWIYHLNSIKRQIESQLARHKTKIQSMLGDQRAIDAFVKREAVWKSGALSMRSTVEGRLAEARLIANNSRSDLLKRIQTHRDMVLANPDDTEAAEEELWRVLG